MRARRRVHRPHPRRPPRTTRRELTKRRAASARSPSRTTWTGWRVRCSVRQTEKRWRPGDGSPPERPERHALSRRRTVGQPLVFAWPLERRTMSGSATAGVAVGAGTGSLAKGSNAGDLGAVLIGSVRLTPGDRVAGGAVGAAVGSAGGKFGGGVNASPSTATARLPAEAAKIHDATIFETFRIPQLLRGRTNRTDRVPSFPQNGLSICIGRRGRRT